MIVKGNIFEFGWKNDRNEVTMTITMPREYYEKFFQHVTGQEGKKSNKIGLVVGDDLEKI